MTGEHGPARALAGILYLAMLLAGCGGGGEVYPAVLQPPASNGHAPTVPDHVTLPADDRLHDNLTEWLYYTGHLKTADGGTYGFELVVFQGQRAGTPPAYAAHFAITDNARGSFQFAEKTLVANQPQPASGFDISMDGWRMAGENGHDHLVADMDGYKMDITLQSEKPPVAHAGKGVISFGPAGDSYYYSRTRLATSGTLVDHGRSLTVTGLSWMDHQWGDFISAGGGWDWFSLQFDDDSELMLFILRDASGKPATSYGTEVQPDGTAKLLDPSSFTTAALSSWTSPRSGIKYPSGWTVRTGDVALTLTPTVKDQELRTTASTGVIYWEGDVSIQGERLGRPINGQGYTELVGY